MSDTPTPRLTPLQAGTKAVHGIHVVDSSGNIISSFGGSGGTAQNDQSAFTVGASALTPAGGLYEAAPSSVPDGDVGVFGITPKRSLKTTLYDSSGVEITSFGGGVQYTEGDVDTTITGTAAMAEGPSNTLQAIQVDANKDLKVLLITGQAGITGGAGAVAANTPRVTHASDDPVVAVLGATTGAAVITDANGTIQQYLRGLIKLAITAGSFLVTATVAAGTAIIGKVGIDQTTPGTTDSVTVATGQGAGAAIGATTGAKVITDANGTIQQYLRGLIYQLITAGASFFTPVPDTANGWSVALMTSSDGSTALTGTAQVIKASAGKLGGWYIYNPNSSATYVHIYNVAAASVTVGTTNPLVTLCIPATSAANLELVMGIPFSNAGWSAAATTTGPGNTNPGTALEAMFLYK